MLDQDEIQLLKGSDAYGSDGEKIGQISRVYLDDQTGQPSWATVTTGFLGTSVRLVPLGPAEFYEDRVVVPCTRDLVQAAPEVGADDEHLSPEQEDELYRHYGLTGDETVSDVNGTTHVSRRGASGGV